MLEKLEDVVSRFAEVERLLTDPYLINDLKKFKELNREYKELSYIAKAYQELRQVKAHLGQSKDIIANEQDEELRDMAKAEVSELEPRVLSLENDLKQLLIPKDPEDGKNVIMEIRAGTGGDEACLFAGDLNRMYQRYCERKGWKYEVNDFTPGPSGGFREIIATVIGEDVYGHLKFESGVHRVQRVPTTETQGRVHTSAATVIALPEVEDFEVDLKESDIRKETFCSSGPGGQSVNTTYSAVRLTHIPTGIVVSMQDEKSQIKNMEKALRNLRAKIYDLEMSRRESEQSAIRKTLVSSGDRSAKIRTYNFPQSRISEHRIGLTLYNLPTILEGALDEIIEPLRIEENTNKLTEGIN
ncbi:MAG: peptide chain release factor 1 [Sphingobacteriia bacterium]|nr:peptide chain release factor 1 [Sphingobacteriia bacterium]